MKLDPQFTEKVQAWLDTPAAERDNALGALLLLQLSNNQIMYRNLSADPDKRAEFIEYQIRKYMKFRLASVTHEQVVQMQRQVRAIVELRHLDASPVPVIDVPHDADVQSEEAGSAETAPAASSNSTSTPQFAAGKRADHDSLPVEIQALYVENASIMQKMREVHLQLRKLSVENATCPDSERYPFLKELIALDKKYHANWHLYDSYSTEAAAQGAEQSLIEDARQAEKTVYRQINLTKGRYKKNPSDKLKAQIAELYAQLASPVPTLTEELISLGILPSPETTEVGSGSESAD